MGTRSMKEIINDINEDSFKKNLNEINEINDRSMKKPRNSRISYTEHLADELVKIYNAPKSRKFFLKCAWNLSEDTIWSAVEDSRKRCVSSPIALFIFICNQALQTSPIEK